MDPLWSSPLTIQDHFTLDQTHIRLLLGIFDYLIKSCSICIISRMEELGYKIGTAGMPNCAVLTTHRGCP